MPSRSSSMIEAYRLAYSPNRSSVPTSFTANNATYSLGAMFDSPPPIPTVWQRLLWGSFLADSPEE